MRKARTVRRGAEKVCEAQTAHISTGGRAVRAGMYWPGLFPVVK